MDFSKHFFLFWNTCFWGFEPVNPKKLYFSEKNFDSAKYISNTDIISFIWAILKKNQNQPDPKNGHFNSIMTIRDMKRRDPKSDSQNSNFWNPTYPLNTRGGLTVTTSWSLFWCVGLDQPDTDYFVAKVVLWRATAMKFRDYFKLIKQSFVSMNR
jgi:hypothetical protein